MANRTKAAAYHGVQNMKFALKEGSIYSTSILSILYAKSINPTALLDAADQYADNRLLFRIPKDDGYEGEIGTTAPDPELEKTGGFAMEGVNGLIRTNMANYIRGALYYEFVERDSSGQASVVKVWMYNVELGKGSETHNTDTNSIEFGEYAYPFRAYGDTLMDNAGSKAYLDKKGLGRTAFMYTARPEETGYATFGESVPIPKVAAAPVG